MTQANISMGSSAKLFTNVWGELCILNPNQIARNENGTCVQESANVYFSLVTMLRLCSG